MDDKDETEVEAREVGEVADDMRVRISCSVFSRTGETK